MEVPLHGQAHRSPQGLQLADPDVTEFRFAQTQVAESELCGSIGYVDADDPVPAFFDDEDRIAPHNYDPRAVASIVSKRSDTPVNVPRWIWGAFPASRMSSFCAGSMRR